MPLALTRCSVLALALAWPLALAHAQEAAPAASDLTRIEGELGTSTARQAELVKQMEAALAEQEALSARLVAMAADTSTQEQALARTEKRMDKLQKELSAVQLALASQQDVLSDILAGLQQLEQNPPPALVVEPHDVLAALRSAMLFGAVVPELRSKAEGLERQLTELAQLKSRLSDEARQKADALTALDVSRAGMLKLIEEKKALAATSQQDLAAEQKRGATLADQARTVKQLLARLEEDRLAREAAASAAAKAEADARAEAERRRREALATPAMPFAMTRGKLAYPAQGTLVKTYGEESGLGAKLDGIAIATAADAQVITPADGKVEFAGPFRSYGQLVIINAGDGYLMLLAGLGQILATPGQAVKAGEPVGLMGKVFSGMAIANGLTQQKTPVLYVEFRKNGDPVDPAPWWAGNRQEAMR